LNSKLRDSVLAGLLIAAIGGLIAMYADIQVLKSQIAQIQGEQRYYHGEPVKP